MLVVRYISLRHEEHRLFQQFNELALPEALQEMEDCVLSQGVRRRLESMREEYRQRRAIAGTTPPSNAGNTADVRTLSAAVPLTRNDYLTTNTASATKTAAAPPGARTASVMSIPPLPSPSVTGDAFNTRPLFPNLALPASAHAEAATPLRISHHTAAAGNKPR